MGKIMSCCNRIMLFIKLLLVVDKIESILI